MLKQGPEGAWMKRHSRVWIVISTDDFVLVRAMAPKGTTVIIDSSGPRVLLPGVTGGYGMKHTVTKYQVLVVPAMADGTPA